MRLVEKQTYDKYRYVSEQLREFISLTKEPQASMLRRSLDDLDYGASKILFMGRLKSGKSTLINSIIGDFQMSVKDIPFTTTTAITTVEMGVDTDNVEVFYTSKKMSLEQFTKEQELIIMEGICDRFANVDHVEMHSQNELFENGVKLIDSPGLEEANSRTKTTYEYVPKANAIIFTLNATSLFTMLEKNYIAEHFAGKHMHNLFFVVNRIDGLHKGELETNVKPQVREGLRDVFTDENGKFDEDLYNRRVFFIAAYPALCAKMNKPYTVRVGNKDVTVPFPLEETGLPEFEAALKEFLNSDERLYCSLLKMAQAYNAENASNRTTKLAEMSNILGNCYTIIFGYASTDEIIRQLCEIADGSIDEKFKRDSFS